VENVVKILLELPYMRL